ncbi:MAG: misacylated tRNA(Ala) deacylase [Chloroflexota bacterium]|jgi:misacylated tRNA(Ala) deacylase|nr:misacylated tRNA(Ala) deacylase [Chloroflexota bacterium]
MTEDLSSQDAYARSVDGAVTGVEPAGEGGFDITLDRTVFYPGGGGQPSDSGWLMAADGTRFDITGARRSGTDIVHTAGLPTRAPELGERVTAQIDWDRRHLLMRTHTALHTLCGVVWRDHGALVTGGNMEPGRGRLDFEFESLSAGLVTGIEAAVNAEIAAARPIHVRSFPRDEAFAIPDLIRTKVNLLPEGIQVVRAIEIEGLDLQADGGTHVANTREVGPIRVTGYESKGRINKRIRIELAGA